MSIWRSPRLRCCFRTAESRGPRKLRYPREDERRPVSTVECGSGCRIAVKRCALGPAGRPWGDSGAGHLLSGNDVGPGARLGGNRDGDVLLQAGVALGVVRRAGLPAAPEDAAPRPAERAQRAAVVMPAGSGVGVAVSSPGVPPAGDVRERSQRVAQSLVARPPELGVLALA